MPKGRTGHSSPGVKDRVKHPKLVGADVYVVRLVNESAKPRSDKKHRGKEHQDMATMGNDKLETCSISSGISASTGSLYEELTCKSKEPEVQTCIAPEIVDENRLVAESRPCYRCVSYMHSVGIKRVFWTTNEGKWEGAKVRDLIDQLEGTMASSDSSLGLPIPDVFVTKHEVLLLRRLMMDGE